MRRRLRKTRAILPLQPPVRERPDLPVPTLSPEEQRWLPVYRAGLLSRAEYNQLCPGVIAKLILISALTERRRALGEHDYAIFDQLPRGIRDIINMSDAAEVHFTSCIRKRVSVETIKREMRQFIKTRKTIPNLADL